MDEESDEDGGKIVPQLLERFRHILHLQMGQQHYVMCGLLSFDLCLGSVITLSSVKIRLHSELHATHNDDLSGDEEADSDGCEVDDPGGDAHHHHRHRREEVEQGAPLLPARRDGDPGHDAVRGGNSWFCWTSCLLPRLLDMYSGFE